MRRYADPCCQAELDQLRAGSDPTPVAEGERHTAGQLWHHLLEASTPRRLYVLNQFLEAQDDALRCVLTHDEDPEWIRRLAADEAAYRKRNSGQPQS